MFPLNWNIPFIRKNGSRTTLGAITGDIAGIEADVAGLEGDVNDLTDKTDGLWDNMLENGAVNLLQITASSQVINGATFTVNADKTISVHTSGETLAQNAQLVQNVTLPSGTYKQTGCPSGGSDSKYRIGGFNGNDYGNGRLISSDGTTRQLYFTIFSGMNIPADTPIIFKPMISDPSLDLSYDDYVPYAKSNRELTEVNEYEEDTTSISGVRIMKRNNVVTLKVTASFDIVHNQNYVVGQLPERFRPPVNVVAPITTNEGTPKLTVLSLNSTGQVEINGYMIATSGTYPFDGSITFVTNK